MLQLLMKNPEKRLTDLLALQNTSFYSNFNFTAVLEKKVGPYGLVIVQLNLYPIYWCISMCVNECDFKVER